MTTIRLLLRQHRWVVGFTVAAALGLTVAALVAWAALSGLSTPAHCIEDRFLDPMPPECAGTEEFLASNEELAGKVMAAMAVLPLLAGILLGAPLVASEIETRTATIAWSLGPSRRRWLAVRLAILAAGFAVVLVGPAVTADMLAAVRPPQYDMSTATLVDYGLRGPLVVFRGLAAFSIAVVVGLALGRVLPALLVAGVAVIVMWSFLGSWMSQGWPPPEEIVCAEDHYCLDYGAEPMYVDASGVRRTFDEVLALSPVPPDKSGEPGAAFYDWLAANFEQISLAIPGEKLAFVETREEIGLAIFSVVLLGASVLLIERRRPA